MTISYYLFCRVILCRLLATHTHSQPKGAGNRWCRFRLMVPCAVLFAQPHVNASIVFQDSFETATLVPGKPNSPQTGTYPTGTVAPESNVVPAGGLHPTPPDASLRILNIVGKQRTYADPTGTGAAGETVTYECDLYASSTGPYMSFGLVGNTGNESLDGNPMTIWLQITNTGDVQYRNGGAWRSSGLAHPLNAWQHYKISYTIGQTNFALTAGSSSAWWLKTNSSLAPSTISRVLVAAGGTTATRAYVDNPAFVARKSGYTIPASQAAPYEIPRTVAQHQPAAEIISEMVLAKQPGRYIGWPSIARAANGDLLVIFSGDRDWHVDPWGKVMMVRSTDGGMTWGAPQVVIDTPIDDRGTSLVALADADGTNPTLMLTFYSSNAWDDPTTYPQYVAYSQSLSPELKAQLQGPWMIQSSDNGLTWSPPVKQPDFTPHGPTALSNGHLILARPTVYDSGDRGMTWTEIATIARPASWNSSYSFLSESHAVQTADNRIVALARYKNGTDIQLRQYESGDGGVNWTEPSASGLRGYPPHLLRLQNNVLVAAYGLRVAPLGQRASLSVDHGRSWLVNDEIVLSNAVPQDSGHLGYPSSVQLPDGTVWTVYYQIEKVVDGEYPCLMATHWRPVGQ